MISLQGRWIPTWHHTFMIREEQGNALCIAVVITDITERKQAEEALRASEERFRSYFVQGLIGMAVTSPDKRWQEVNDRLCEILGYSRDKLIGMQRTAVTHPDDREAGRLLFDRMTTGENRPLHPRKAIYS